MPRSVGVHLSLQRITAHMRPTEETFKAVRELIYRQEQGVLSSISVHLEGMPFGSVANYCVGLDGSLLFYFSTIAQHSLNLAQDDRCSLTILESGGGNVQEEARITLSGRMRKLEEDEVIKKTYQRYFPKSKGYADFHDFDFYQLDCSKIRYIGGFGKIYWLEPEQVLEAAPFTAEQSDFMIEHMNDHHLDSLVTYMDAYAGVSDASADDLEMIGVARHGLDLRYKGEKHHITATRPMDDPKAAREVLTEMSKQASDTI